MEVTRRRGRRRKKLLDDLREGRGYCHMKEEALNRTMWRNRFGGDIGDLSLDRLLNERTFYPVYLRNINLKAPFVKVVASCTPRHFVSEVLTS